MQLWMILILIVFVLWMISLVRVGIVLEYNGAGLTVTACVGPIKFTIFPMKKKDKPSKSKKEKKKSHPVEAKPQKGGNLTLVQKFLPLVSEAAGRFREKVRIDIIELELIWGSSDPAAAAMGFGYANVALGMLWPIIEHNFNVREQRLQTSVDFNATKPTITIHAAISLTIGQGVILGAVLGFKVIRLFRSYHKEQKIKEAV